MFCNRFRLKVPTIAVQQSAVDKPTITRLPEGAEVLVMDNVLPTSTDQPNCQINVECNGGIYSMFLLDIQKKGELLPPK
jgi:hypothetical protein